MISSSFFLCSSDFAPSLLLQLPYCCHPLRPRVSLSLSLASFCSARTIAPTTEYQPVVSARTIAHEVRRRCLAPAELAQTALRQRPPGRLMGEDPPWPTSDADQLLLILSSPTQTIHTESMTNASQQPGDSFGGDWSVSVLRVEMGRSVDRPRKGDPPNLSPSPPFLPSLC